MYRTISSELNKKICKHKDGVVRLAKYYGKNNGKFACVEGCGLIVASSKSPILFNHVILYRGGDI